MNNVLPGMIHIEVPWLPPVDARFLFAAFSMGVLLLSFSCGLKFGDGLFSFRNLMVFVGVDLFVVLVYILKFGAVL